jgi:hypothetical protein
MIPFLRRRAGALTEGLVLAMMASVLAAVTGFGSMTGAHPTGEPVQGSGAPATTLEGVLDVESGAVDTDGAHWTATLNVDGREIKVKLTHGDSHRPELSGSKVNITGSWATDGSFVAATVAPVGGDDPLDADTLLAAAMSAVPGDATPKPGKGSGKRVTVAGSLSFAHGDDVAGGRRTPTRYLVTDRKGVSTEIKFARTPSGKLAGREVRLTGTMNGSMLVADGGTTTSTTTTTTSSLVAKTSSSGAHRVAVILFNWQDAVSEPYTPATAYGIAFTNSNSVAAYYAETSWGNLGLSGDVYGWYTLPVNRGTGCAYSTWANAATTAAAANGFAYADYDNVVYAFPASSACGWSGLNGTSGMALGTMAHELGHNFGTHHANTISCTKNGVRVALVADISTCAANEYGDPYSVMGGSAKYHHTGFTRSASYAWVDASGVVTATSSGDYTVTPAEAPGGTPVVRIPRASGQYLTLEFRQPYGVFDTFASTSPVVNGVTLRVTGSAMAPTQLVDCTPATTMFSDAACPVGTTLTDPLTGVSITTLSVAASGAIVRISFGGAAPAPAPTPAPTPTLTPSPTQAPSPSPAPTPAPMPTSSPTATPLPTPAPTPTPTPSPTATPAPDAQSPTAPANLKASVARSGKVSLSWGRSSDNVKVAGYRVYRDATLVATATTTKWSDVVAFANGSARSYYVVAYDAAGNVSPSSNMVTLQ